MDEKPLIVGSFDTLAQLLSQNGPSEGLSSLLDLTNEFKASVSLDKSGLQSSFSFRVQQRARLISQEILTERGNLDKDRLRSVIQELESYPYILYPEGSFDALAMPFAEVIKVVPLKTQMKRSF